MKLCLDRTGLLSNQRRTATGGYLVDATLARVGVLAYREDGRTVRHLNTPEVLQTALDGVASAPVTNRHPKRFVDADSYRAVVAGHVVGAPRFEDGHIRATLAILDAKLIEDIELGVVREVSMGYHVEVEPEEGVTDAGEPYDLVRKRIEWNHIAIVPKGRAGGSVRLLLDSDEIPDNEEKMLKIDGAEVSEDAAQAQIDAALGRRDGEIAQLRTDLEKARAELADALSPESVQRAVDEAQAKAAAEAERQAKREKVSAAFPSLKLDEQSDEYVSGLFDALSARDAASALIEAPKTKAKAKEARVDARQQMIARKLGQK